MNGIALAAILIGVPAVLFALWPVLRGRARARTFFPLPVDRRQQLAEEKRAALAALRELAFEHDAGHVGDADYADLRARYEGEAAAVLLELDRLGPGEPAPSAPFAAEGRRRSAWRHPLGLAAAAALLVTFGIAVGAGVVRYTEPDPMVGRPAAGSRPLAPLLDAPAAGGGTSAPRPVTPEVLGGMLQAARASLFEGRYTEAIAAYQAVLKRDPKNVDAMTHLGLIVAIGGGPEHVDRALETFDRALAIDANYPPALLYRGQLLYETKRDVPGAIRSWEKFIAVTPPGEDRDRVDKLLREARAKR